MANDDITPLTGTLSILDRALVARHLTTGNDATDLSVYTTASITPSPDALVLAWVASTTSVGAGATVPTLTSSGLTWEQVATQTFGSTTVRITLFRALGAVPAAGSVTITFGNQQWACVWSISEFSPTDTSGTNGSGAVVQSVTNQNSFASDLILTLAPLATDNMGVAGHGGISGNLFSPGPGWTLLGRDLVSAPVSLITQWDASGDPTANIVWGGSGNLAGIAAEVVALVGRTQILVSTTPTKGTLTLTGIAPVRLTGTVSPPLVGSLTLVGIDPMISVLVTPLAGALTLTGSAPRIATSTDIPLHWLPGHFVDAHWHVGHWIESGPLTLRPPVVALTLVGVAPTVVNTAPEDTGLTPLSGTLVLSGIAPTVVIPADTAVTPQVGALVLTGIAPTVEVTVPEDTGLTPLVGALTLVGIVSTLINTTPEDTGLTPLGGTLVLSGIVPSVEPSTVVPLEGALTLTGYDVVVFVSGGAFNAGWTSRTNAYTQGVLV